MDMSMKVALITGGASGLGRDISMAMLKQGYYVAVNYLSSDNSAGEITSRAGGRAIAIQADVGDRAQAGNLIMEIKQAFGRLDILINNAGITKDSLLIRQKEADWDAVIRTNLTGPFNLIRAAAPLMISSGGGHILNISSYSGIKGKAGQAAYSASKAGLIGLTMAAAYELATHDIRVNAIIPGYMLTRMGAASAQAIKEAEDQGILRALSDPKDAARSIAFIAGMDYITGQLLSLDSRML